MPVTCNQPSGITYPVGTTHVTCSATIMRSDSNGVSIGGLPTGTTDFAIVVSPTSSNGTSTGSTGSTGTAGTTGGGTTDGSSNGATPANNSVAASSSSTQTVTILSHPNVKVDATTRKGAQFSFVVSTSNPASGATCLPRAGSFFPLGVQATTKTTTVTCNVSSSAAAKSMSFKVTVLGEHDQLTALESQVLASKLANRPKLALISSLNQANNLARKGDATHANRQLGTFIELVGKAPLAGRTKSSWIEDAARIVAILG